jgi:antitoxin (DNA-binding transcriptional repressor) of toxin-antitoxin stability system
MDKMLKKVSALKARQNLGRIMDEVALGGDDYIIERGGRAMVAIVRIEKYQQIKDSRKVALQALGRIWEKMKDEEPAIIEKTIKEAAKEIRRV